MADLGALAVLLALALASYAAVGSALGAWRRLPDLVTSARYATYLTVPVIALAVAILINAFLTHDFSIRYVAAHSSRDMAPWLTWVAFYAGNEGSLLYIALVLSAMSALAIALCPGRIEASRPYTNTVLMLTLAFLLGILATLASPFVRLPFTPLDGQGINPLLTHPGMFFHPPVMMTGLMSVVVPFAFGMGALLAGKVGDEWLEAGRTWGLVSWLILSLGNLLGAWWAYTNLGWGGYWRWDPVENAWIMAWFPLTAFLHSIVVQRQRGMFRMWNVALIIAAFGLAQYGMFMNRGGSVPSIHSFGQSTLGWMFLLFMGASMVGSIGIFLWRYTNFTSAASLESGFSREAAFLGNNLLLLAITFVIVWGTTFPLLSEALRGAVVTVARPYYDQVTGPLFLALILLMAVGPLLPWRRASWRGVGQALVVPGGVAVAVVAVSLLVGIRKPYPVVAFGVCALAVGGVLREWVRGTRARQRKGENPLLAFAGLIAANRPRYGGYVVHLAIVLLALGVTGSSFYRVQRDVTLAPGQRITVGDYTLQYLGATALERPNRVERRARLQVLRKTTPIATLTTGYDFYPNNSPNTATRAAIRSTPVEDLYIITSEFTEDGSAVFRILVNPLVLWIWVAGPLLILGTLVALWPGRRPVPYPVRVAEKAPATAGAPLREKKEG
ncbi:MAG: heme lyase CcmF/NrfE family subunit [Chloroflexi bacterium]|nr:heme lyase CcmF/NrfE family subunit [Chloroflexota bacterium]